MKPRWMMILCIIQDNKRGKGAFWYVSLFSSNFVTLSLWEVVVAVAVVVVFVVIVVFVLLLSTLLLLSILLLLLFLVVVVKLLVMSIVVAVVFVFVVVITIPAAAAWIPCYWSSSRLSLFDFIAKTDKRYDLFTCRNVFNYGYDTSLNENNCNTFNAERTIENKTITLMLFYFTCCFFFYMWIKCPAWWVTALWCNLFPASNDASHT